MNVPLNIDWQQILLHWLNLAILTGGLYFLLFNPVKAFMEKREAHYKELDRQADQKLEEARQVQEEYQSKMAAMEEELRQTRIQSQQAVQKSVEEQLAQAKLQAEEIIKDARIAADHSREKAIKDSQRELKKLAAEAAEKLAFHPGEDPFDQFLNLAEGGKAHESR